MKIALDHFESLLLLHCKHHSPWGRKEGLGKLYKKHYAMDDIRLAGVYDMVTKLFYKLWHFNGSRENELEDVFINSLPSDNWKVADGYNFGPFPSPESLKFTEEEMIWARILSMASYISLTNVTNYKIEKITEDDWKAVEKE